MFVESEFGVELNSLEPVSTFVPDLLYQMFVAETEYLASESNRDAATRFLAANLRANSYVQDEQNREDAVAMFAKVTDRSPEIAEFALDSYGPKLADSCEAGIPDSALEYTLALLVDQDLVSPSMSRDDVIDSEACDDVASLLDS
jgi:ABC-type nitrate/sulfonate/bicarbonate transport system substrate-binding protein